MAIPRLVHLGWFGEGTVPRDVERARASWEKQHRAWEVRLWRPDDLAAEAVRPEALDPLRAPTERWQLALLGLLGTHGGVAVDARLTCVGPIDSLVADHELVALRRPSGEIDGGILAAVPDHPLVREAAVRAQPREYWGLDLSQTGSVLLTEVLSDADGVALVPTSDVFGPPPSIAVDGRPLALEDARALALATEAHAKALADELQAVREHSANARRDLAQIDVEVSGAPMRARARTLYRLLLPTRRRT